MTPVDALMTNETPPSISLPPPLRSLFTVGRWFCWMKSAAAMPCSCKPITTSSTTTMMMVMMEKFENSFRLNAVPSRAPPWHRCSSFSVFSWGEPRVEVRKFVRFFEPDARPRDKLSFYVQARCGSGAVRHPARRCDPLRQDAAAKTGRRAGQSREPFHCHGPRLHQRKLNGMRRLILFFPTAWEILRWRFRAEGLSMTLVHPSPISALSASSWRTTNFYAYLWRCNILHRNRTVSYSARDVKDGQ